MFHCALRATLQKSLSTQAFGRKYKGDFAVIDPEPLVEDFLAVAELAQIRIGRTQITVESLPAPHRPPSHLPAGQMAVYVFAYGDTTLKVGKAGSNSQARYISQHYNAGSAPSTLAASLLKRGEEIGVSDLSNESVSEGIKTHTDRINFILDSEAEIDSLSLLEVFLHCRLKPAFEGFASQR